MEDREAQLLLSPLREVEPAGPGAVDVDRAVRRGRVVHRGRIAASALGVVVAVVAGALVVPSLAHRDAAPATSAGEFSVLRQEFSVGAAAGFTEESYTTGRYRQTAVLAGAKTEALVTFYAKGHPPEPGWAPRGDRAAPVFGRAAYYLANPVSPYSAVELAWQWAPGGWAIVSLPNAIPAQRSAVHEIAAHTGARYDGRVRTPFTVGDLPPGVHLIGITTTTVRPPMPVISLELGESDSPSARIAVTVSVGYDLREATMRPLGGRFVATVSGAAPQANQQRVLDSVRLSVGPDPTDIAYWTTNPIR